MAAKADRGVEAFVLLEAKAGKAIDLARQLSRIKGVTAAYAVTGPFDLIVHAEAADFKAVTQLVVSKIQTLPAVNRTLTCIVVEKL